jgi:hypothetical protein
MILQLLTKNRPQIVLQKQVTSACTISGMTSVLTLFASQRHYNIGIAIVCLENGRVI